MSNGDLTDCIIWDKATTRAGYGVKFDPRDGKIKYAHRLAYEDIHGEIPEGMHIDHLCCTRACINPDHLEAVTLAENNRRMYARMKAQRRKRSDAKLTYEDIELIRKRCIPRDRVHGVRAIAREYGVSHQLLSELLAKQ